jgi:hypothetical protein
MKIRKIMPLILGLSLFSFVIAGSGCRNSEYKFGELTYLADKYGTDKGSGGHSYTELYEHFFWPIKYKASRICEIGIAEGASLKMFKAYFPNAVYYGIDIDDLSGFNSDTVKTFIADQADREQGFIYANGYDFDIILDDGGHTMEQQQVSFGYLFKCVKPEGYYIIEDLHTSLPEYYKDTHGAEENEKNTTLTMVNTFIRSGKIKSTYMTTEEEDYLTANIEYCNLFSRNEGHSITCIFKKRQKAHSEGTVPRY